MNTAENIQKLYPVHYQIKLVPDLNQFTFTGTVLIDLIAHEPATEIQLNIVDIAVRKCTWIVNNQKKICEFYINSEEEQMKILLPEPTQGSIQISIDYHGQINSTMRGFYRCKYRVDGKEKYMAVTQFQESDARSAFPCIDHPAYKATFGIEMIIDHHLTAISNQFIAEETYLESGKKRVLFHRTPKMSTYLLFFGVGEFDCLQDIGNVTIRALTPPSMSQYARCALEFGRKSFDFCQAYYGVPYPLPKLDLIAVPDFAFGAMENWGAMTFRENLLLVFPELTSNANLERIYEVISHEIAHQWFGDLVTPKSWKYLWLNESFATYFGYRVVANYYPDWCVWERFLYNESASAMSRDGLHETVAIEIPGGEHVVINASTAPIIYNKGGSILRQINGYIGDNAFQQGIQHFLRQFAYDTATSDHLWESLENLSQQPVVRIMKGWVEQLGFPEIQVEKQGNQLILSQNRFTYIPNTFDQQWPIPVSISMVDAQGNISSTKFLMETQTAAIDIQEPMVAYKLNEGQSGFYRVWYKQVEDRHNLCNLIREQKISPQDRFGIENDLFAYVKSNRLSVSEYLNFLSNYEQECHFLPLLSISDHIHSLYIIMNDSYKSEITKTGVRLIENMLNRIGYEPQANEPHPVSILRDYILFQGVSLGSESLTVFTQNQYQNLRKGQSIHPNIMKSIYQTGAFFGKTDDFEWMQYQIDKTQSEHQRLNILSALAYFQPKEILIQLQKYILETIPSRNKYLVVIKMTDNPCAIPLIWDWYIRNLNVFEQFHPVHHERVIEAIVPICGLEKTAEVKAFISSYEKQHPALADTLHLSLEKLNINLQFRSDAKIN